MIKVENPVAFNFIMQDEIYLLATELAIEKTPRLPAIVMETQPTNFNYLGGNKKKFLVVVNYPHEAVIEQAHFVALENIFKRLGLAIQDIAILNRANYQDTAFDTLVSFFAPTKLLLLGQSALPKGIGPIALNTPKPIAGCHTLLSYSFDEMMENTDYKKAFWEQMKRL